MTAFVPPFSHPDTNRKVILSRRPTGIPQPEDFQLVQAPLDAIGEGQFRVRNIYLSVDPAQRGWAGAAANYSEPVPLGAVMRALAVGVVTESRCAEVAQGLYVYGWFGWQDYAVAGPEAILTRFPAPSAPLSAYAGVLGINGLTAWLALTKIGRPQPGETVLVSTAAGAVGSLVGQIARSEGCRVVGLTGDDIKVSLCTGRFGYHAAANYKVHPLEASIAALAPDGIDIFFDNVGGSILDCALRQIKAVAALTQKITNGSLLYEEDVQIGIEHAPSAIARLYAGNNSGKSLIFVGD